MFQVSEHRVCRAMEKPRSICLSAIDGLTLMHHFGQGKIKAEFDVNTATYDGDSTILSGIVVGDEKPEERMVIIGHRDYAIPPGANDNGSSLGCLLELARVLGHYKFRRSVEFICSTAEEGCSPGMAQYVQMHKDRTNKVKAAINLDMFGTGGRLQLVESSKWHNSDTFEFSHWVKEALETAADDVYYHSITDTPEMVDANSLKALFDITAMAVMRIVNLEPLP